MKLNVENLLFSCVDYINIQKVYIYDEKRVTLCHTKRVEIEKYYSVVKWTIKNDTIFIWAIPDKTKGKYDVGLGNGTVWLFNLYVFKAIVECENSVPLGDIIERVKENLREVRI